MIKGDGRNGYPPNFFLAVATGLLSVFLIGFNVEPARCSFLDNAVEGVGYFLYFVIDWYFVAREKAYFLVFVEVNQTVGAHDD